MGQAQPIATEFVNIVFVPFYRKDQGLKFDQQSAELKDLYMSLKDLENDVKSDREFLSKLRQKRNNLGKINIFESKEQREIIFYNAGELPDEPVQRDPRLSFFRHPQSEKEKLDQRIKSIEETLNEKQLVLEQIKNDYEQQVKEHDYKQDQYFGEKAWIGDVIAKWDTDLKSFPGSASLYTVKARRNIEPQMIRYLTTPSRRLTTSESSEGRSNHLVAIIYIIHNEEELDTLLQTPRKTLLIAEMNRNDPNGSCQKVDWLTKLQVRHPHLHLYRVHRDIGEFEQPAKKYCHYESLIDILPNTRTSDDLIEGADKMLALLTLHAK